MIARIAAMLFCATTAAALSGCSSDPTPANGSGGGSGTTTTTTGGAGGGAVTGPTLAAFQKSACKKEAQTQSGTPGEAAQALSADEVYAGLECVSWSPIEGGFRVLLRNVDSVCGAEWAGEVNQVGGGVELRLVNPKCQMANCGSCIYDFTFDVKMKAAAGGDEVSIVLDTCPGQQPAQTEKVTLPLGAAPTGELCRYADASSLGWQAMSLGTCGKAYMPCREANGMCLAADGGAACDDGLTCADGASAAGGVCHAPCKVDGDCAPTGVMKCDAGLCRPAHPY